MAILFFGCGGDSIIITVGDGIIIIMIGGAGIILLV